jgi:inhibitor of cysteine peptidase
MDLKTHLLLYPLQIVLLVSLAAPGHAHVLELDELDSGRTVTLKSTETLTIVLRGNPTTGFTWEITQLDTDMLMPEGEPAFTADSHMIGSGGKFTFRFLPINSGRTRLKLIYRRPWEKGVAPLKTFEVVVDIQQPAGGP